MPSKIRLQRIEDRIRDDLSVMVIQKLSDPRVEGAFITDVKVDREFAFADVFVSAVEGAERSKEILAGFDHASGFLRKQLASQIELRVFPKLRFHWDPTPENADHIEKLLAQLRNESKPTEVSDNNG
jgi:ribosome-binding factor A